MSTSCFAPHRSSARPGGSCSCAPPTIHVANSVTLCSIYPTSPRSLGSLGSLPRWRRLLIARNAIRPSRASHAEALFALWGSRQCQKMETAPVGWIGWIVRYLYRRRAGSCVSIRGSILEAPFPPGRGARPVRGIVRAVCSCVCAVCAQCVRTVMGRANELQPKHVPK